MAELSFTDVIVRRLSELRATEQMDREIERLERDMNRRREAEQRRVPVETRDAVIEMSERIGAIERAILALHASSRRSALWLIWLTVALVVLTLVLAVPVAIELA